MKIGIKYCGGCNSRYDRTREVDKLKKQFPQHQFSYTTNQGIYDICLLVCGCMTSCATPEGVAAKRFELLYSPEQFAKLAGELEREDEAAQAHAVHTLHLGETSSLQKTFTESDVQAFAALTGNYGKIYTDTAFAAQYGHGRPAVHRALVGCLFPALMEDQFPGNGSILQDEQIRYMAPVFPGDTITATIILTEAEEQGEYFMATFHGSCRNQDGALVAEGTYRQLLPKTLFTVQQ